MPNDLDLDGRIRALVSSAVADAPTAPDVDFVRPVAVKRARWPKWTAVLAALLAAGGATVALQPAHDGDVDTTQNTTATTQFVSRETSVIVTSGPDGVHEIVDGKTHAITAEPMTIALGLDDGSVVAQRHAGDGRVPDAGWTNTDTLPTHFAPDGASAPLLSDVAVDGGVILHDFSVIDGRRLLLYGTEDRFTRGFTEHLYTLDIDTNETAPVGTVGSLGGGVSRLSMARTGLIVGMNYDSTIDHGLLALAVPGSPAAGRPLPNETDFWAGRRGSPDSVYPTGYAVDPEGTRLFWIMPKDTPMNQSGGGTVMSAPLDDPKAATAVNSENQLDDQSHFYGVYGLETDPSDRGVIVNPGNRFAQTKPPVLINGNSLTTLPGGYATAGWQG